MKTAVRLFNVYVFLFLFSQSILVNAQRYHTSSPKSKTDSVYVFSGRLKILLRSGVYNALPADVLAKEYGHQFGVGQPKESYGFVIEQKDTLRFYQTSLERPLVNDGSLTIWKMIDSIVYKIPNGRWVESGWDNMMTDYLYFVKLVANEKEFYEFNFFFIDDKLTFSVYQRSSQETYAHKPENYVVYHL